MTLLKQRFYPPTGSRVALCIGIVVLFLLTRFGLPLLYTGSYIDEYNHVHSAILLADQGEFPTFNSNSPYRRGSYVTVALTWLFALFGRGLYAAKLLPIAVGTASFGMLIAVSRHLLSSKWRYVFLLTYVVYPWILFNHNYIRMHVFYELFLVLVTFIYVMPSISSSRGSWGKTIAWLILLAVTVLFVDRFSFDKGKLPVLLYAGLLVAYWFIFQLPSPRCTNGWFPGASRLGSIRARLILVVVGILALFIAADAGQRLRYLLPAELSYTAPSDRKYDTLFL